MPVGVVVIMTLVCRTLAVCYATALSQALHLFGALGPLGQFC